MKVDNNLLEVREYNGMGYKPVIDYESWRVAVLNYSDDMVSKEIDKMQRHDETDEVFVLLKGRCILFLGKGKEEITDIIAYDLKPYKIYNVKCSSWHTHILSEEAKVLIIENRNTSSENSREKRLTADQHKKIVELTREKWTK